MKKRPEIVVRNGKPAAVILDIRQYENLLELTDQVEDLRILRAMRKRPLKFRTLRDFLRETAPGV